MKKCNWCNEYCENGKKFYVEYMPEFSTTNPYYQEYIGRCWKYYFWFLLNWINMNVFKKAAKFFGKFKKANKELPIIGPIAVSDAELLNAPDYTLPLTPRKSFRDIILSILKDKGAPVVGVLSLDIDNRYTVKQQYLDYAAVTYYTFILNNYETQLSGSTEQGREF